MTIQIFDKISDKHEEIRKSIIWARVYCIMSIVIIVLKMIGSAVTFVHYPTFFTAELVKIAVFVVLAVFIEKKQSPVAGGLMVTAFILDTLIFIFNTGQIYIPSLLVWTPVIVVAIIATKHLSKIKEYKNKLLKESENG